MDLPKLRYAYHHLVPLRELGCRYLIKWDSLFLQQLISR